MNTTHTLATASVVICAYTLDRLDALVLAIESVQRQSRQASEIIVVIDHNPELLQKIQARVANAASNVVIVENAERRGLSGARNTGLSLAHGSIIAFMDEDAQAASTWLERLIHCYDDASVAGVGGSIAPLWLSGRPKWFPAEFYWVIGCTYIGMPAQPACVRNLIGCNMSFRKEVFEAVGGFRDGMGRIGTLPVGCEETELCIRANQHWPQRRFVFDPGVEVINHRVPATRACWRYFVSRCVGEGLSKALVSNLVGTKDGLSAERTYVFNTLPAGIVKGVADALLRGDASGVTRAVAIIVGCLATTAGFVFGKVRGAIRNQRRPTSFSPPIQFKF